MDALLVGAVMFASVLPASVPASTPVRFTGVAGRIEGRVVSQTSAVYVVENGSGERLTFPQPGQTLRGRLVSVDEDVMSVVLDGQQQVARVPLSSVRDLRISRGRVRAWDHGLMIGAAAGAAVGAGLAAGMCGGEYFQCSAAEGAAFYGAAGAVIGMSIGMFIQRDKWERVEPGSFIR